MKAMYKYELAVAAGVSMTTFRKWCKNDAEILRTLGCRRTTHLLPPAAVEFLCQKYCITIET
jgi:hypothetical protein